MASRSPPVSGNTCQVSAHLGDPLNSPLRPQALGFAGGRFFLAGSAATEPGVQSENNDEQELRSGSCLERCFSGENMAADTDTVDKGDDETPGFDKGSCCNLLRMADAGIVEDIQRIAAVSESCVQFLEEASNELEMMERIGTVRR